MKRLLILPLALSLAGCNLGFMQKDYVSRSETIPVRAVPASVGTIPVQAGPADNGAAAETRQMAALLLPEGAGPVLRIREKNFVNGTRQEIVIATDKGTYGENVIDVHIRTAEPSAKHVNPMMIGPPSESGIRTEILSRFPDVQMNIVTRPMRNGMGPFGLAIGRHPSGSRCIFAWQWIDDLRESSPGMSNLVKMNALMSGRGLAASVRIRLCRSDSTVDQLAAQIEGLRTGSGSALERIARMDRRDADGETVAVDGARGTPLLRPVSSQSLEAAITRPAKREPAPAQVAQATPKPKPKPQKQAERSRPAAERAPKPARRAAPPVQAAPAQAAPAQAALPTAAVPPTTYGQRYLAPVAGVTGPAGYGGPQGGRAAGNLSLPPQAYRGPGAPPQ